MSPEIKEAVKAVVVWQKKSAAASKRRADLPIGSSRARVTTANANWSRAAEMRDRVIDRLESLLATASADDVNEARRLT